MKTSKGSLSVLLEETNLAYYWLGFILADGCISNNKRLGIGLSTKDNNHLIKLTDILNCENPKFRKTSNGYDSCGFSLQDTHNIPKFCKKFDIKPAKTFNPPNIEIFKKMSDELFLSFLCGYIDGDGCIKYQFKRKDVTITIHVHSSWLLVLKYIETRLFSILSINNKCSNSGVWKDGYAYLKICDNTIIRQLKKIVIKLNIPLLERKWDKIDLALKNIHEKVENRFIKILKLKNEGYSIGAISEILNITYNTVYNTLKSRGQLL